MPRAAKEPSNPPPSFTPIERKRNTKQAGKKKKAKKAKPEVPEHLLCDCPFCTRRILKSNFARHVITHYEDCGFGCPWPECEKHNGQRDNVITHVSTHGRVRRKQCPKCGLWSDPARCSGSRHECRLKRKAPPDDDDDDDDDEPKVAKKRKVDHLEAGSHVEDQGHASSSRLQDNSIATLNPCDIPIAGPSGTSYTEYSQDLAFEEDSAAVYPDMPPASGHWHPQPHFTLNDFPATITPVESDASVEAPRYDQPLVGHPAGGEQYYNAPGPSTQVGVAPQTIHLPQPQFSDEFDPNEPWLYSEPEFYPPAQFEFAPQPQFVAQPEPLWRYEPYAQPQLPIALGPELEYIPMPPLPQSVPGLAPLLQPMQPMLAFDMPPGAFAFDSAPAAPDLALPAPASHWQHEPAYMRPNSLLPDWFQQATHNDDTYVTWRTNEPGYPDMHRDWAADAPAAPDIKFDYSGLEFCVGENWEQQPDLATLAHEWVPSGSEQMIPDIAGAAWLVDMHGAR